jgi:hypothetical protein
MARISKSEIDDDNQSLRRRHQEFRRAADALTEAWSSVEAVQRIALIGSVAGPLWKELPRFGRYRRAGIELWHDCKDLDLAIWLSSLEDLSRLNRLRGQTLNQLYRAEGIGVAHHQADVFVLAAGSDRYLGRLCTYGNCPKGKAACQVPGCGDHRFLQQIEGFIFQPATLSLDRSVILFDRAETVHRKAVDLPSLDQRDATPCSGHQSSRGESA